MWIRRKAKALEQAEPQLESTLEQGGSKTELGAEAETSGEGVEIHADIEVSQSGRPLVESKDAPRAFDGEGNLPEGSVVKTFGELEEGDIIVGADGQEVVISRAYDIHVPQRMFEVVNDAGKALKVSGNHLFYIETDLDRSLAANRRKSGAKMLSELLTKEGEDAVVAVAELEPGTLEADLTAMSFLMLNSTQRDAAEFLGLHDLPHFSHMARIARSLGPISQDVFTGEDILTGERDTEQEVVPHYDAVLFARQILALTGRKEFTKRWKLVVGQVVPTTQLVNILEQGVNIPDVVQSLGEVDQNP